MLIFESDFLLYNVKFGAVQKCAHLVELEKMLSNAYFLAKFSFDTAENEPAKRLQYSAKNCKIAKLKIC